MAWTADPDSADDILEAAVWTGSRLVAVGWDGARLASTDGSHWTRMAADTLPRLQSVAWTGSRLVAVGWGSTIVTLPEAPLGTMARLARPDPGSGLFRRRLYEASGRRLPAGTLFRRTDGAVLITLPP
jgi:hypothetical protein